MAKIKILTFLINDRYFALPSASIKEILDSEKSIKQIFYNRGGALRGLLVYEGDMISVLDTEILLDIASNGNGNGKGTALGMDKLVLICKDRELERAIAIVINSIDCMETIEEEELKLSQDESATYTRGFIKEGKGEEQRVVTVLDLKKFLEYSGKRIESLESGERVIN
ncbi:MAG: chemotaxis protein CheW [Deltaproteobacteria bacterium]|nr:chemotaxis protein CheW [Deltaproteobacteria bacterium]